MTIMEWTTIAAVVFRDLRTITNQLHKPSHDHVRPRNCGSQPILGALKRGRGDQEQHGVMRCGLGGKSHRSQHKFLNDSRTDGPTT